LDGKATTGQQGDTRTSSKCFDVSRNALCQRIDLGYQAHVLGLGCVVDRNKISAGVTNAQVGTGLQLLCCGQ
jgi:hypothetical protein